MSALILPAVALVVGFPVGVWLNIRRTHYLTRDENGQLTLKPKHP